MKLCKLGIHHNVFKHEYEQNLLRMVKIGDDLAIPFEKHYDSVTTGTYMSYSECKHCGRVEITIYGKTK